MAGGPSPQPRHTDILTGGIARTPDSRGVPSRRLFPNHRGKAFLVADLMGFCKEGKTLLVKPPPQAGCGNGDGKRKERSTAWREELCGVKNGKTTLTPLGFALPVCKL